MKFAFGLIGFIGIAVPIVLFGLLKIPLDVYSFSFSIAAIGIGIYILIQIFKEFDLQKAFYGTVGFVSVAMILGIPVIDTIFNNNPTHKSILTKKEWIQNSGMNLYSLDAYSPEIWYKYQANIPAIDFRKPETIPQENEFLLVMSNYDNLTNNLTELGKRGFQTEKLDEFDDNEEKPGTKNNVPRKKLVLFKVSKR